MNTGIIARTAGLVLAAALAMSLGLGIAPAARAAPPAQQQAVVQNGTGGPDVLKLERIPVLAPAAGQVLIRIYAAGVNPVDWKARLGTAPGGPRPGRSVPGSDVAGVVAALGPGVTGVTVGQSVFCMKGFAPGIHGLNGAYAHYIVVAASDVVPKPPDLTYAQAAGLGMVGWTGARTMDEAKVHAGERVLITGIAGGVGSSAAQIAVARGAQVIGTATARHEAYLHHIGVSEVLDYHNSDWAAKARGMDVVLDTVGGPTALAAFGDVRRGGVFITVASTEVEHPQITAAQCVAAGVSCPEAGPRRRGAMVPIADLLRQVAALARAGKFTVHVDRSFPLAQAAQAQEYNRAGHTEGKVILDVTPQANSR
ncbi:MAG TPA: NADP-dependent oxidoreductase [Steroidobacteraceae bacterium]|jgi:NADPH:quinone reductase-like Zn-dependent oxidoreductase|nr:NADP-dependent oxidoreductase [Steroidobacteraceae bacterium]